MTTNGISSSSHRILIVDDQADFRRLIVRLLHTEGYSVEEAANGAQGLECASRSAPDLVLLDLGLPDVSGLQVLEQLLASRPSIRVIMITGQADVSVAVQAMKLGACDFIAKPPDMQKLKVAVRSLLRADTDRDNQERWTIFGDSPQIGEVWEQVARYSRPDVSILLTGESGTGKELFAHAIHERSKRSAEPFVALDCATLPDTLVESELFGHEKGAFTGAADRKIGKFEAANGGTIFLDEIGNLPLPFQAKLLRVAQERSFSRLGNNKPIEVDVRIVSATNLDLSTAIVKGTFREDLFYRLAEVVIALPPLRERSNDIEVLSCRFIEEFNRRFGREIQGISPEALQFLRGYRWPGNVRELRNVIKSSLLASDGCIRTEHLPEYLTRSAFTQAGVERIKESIRARVQQGLANGSVDFKGIVSSYSDEVERLILAELLSQRRFSAGELSALLDVDPKTLRSKLSRHGLKIRE